MQENDFVDTWHRSATLGTPCGDGALTTLVFLRRRRALGAAATVGWIAGFAVYTWWIARVVSRSARAVTSKSGSPA